MKAQLTMFDLAEAVGVGKVALELAKEIRGIVACYVAELDRAASPQAADTPATERARATGLALPLSSAGVFISYRRADATREATMLRDAIVKQLAPVLAKRMQQRVSRLPAEDCAALSRTAVSKSIFLDQESIAPGDDFTRVIDNRMAHSCAYVILIGPDWNPSTTSAGSQRLDAADDWVRTEVESALRHDVSVFPVLLRGARMPSAESLPASLRHLVKMQAMRCDSDHQVDSIAEHIVAVAARKEAELHDVWEHHAPAGDEAFSFRDFRNDIGYVGRCRTVTDASGLRPIPHGYGVMYLPLGPLRGMWREGHMDYGVLNYVDGDTYEGEFTKSAKDENDRHGVGIYRLSDGCRFTGQYRNNQQHGFGLYDYADGAWFAGAYLRGARYTGIGCQSGYVVDVVYQGQTFTVPPIPAPPRD